jgi:hypothetical protein
MAEAFIRFIVGGVFVSAFAVLGDVLKPKSFAGLFGAASTAAVQWLPSSRGDRQTEEPMPSQVIYERHESACGY